jgi:hypothetical protein
MGGGFSEAALEANGWQDIGHGDAARLLAAFASDAHPAFAAFDRGFEETLFTARGVHRKDSMDAEFGGLFDNPLEAVELNQRGAESDDDGRGGRGDRFEDAEVNAVAARFQDLGEVCVLVIRNLEALPWFHAEDAGEMAGFFAAKLRGAIGDLIYKESSTGQSIL